MDANSGIGLMLCQFPHSSEQSPLRWRAGSSEGVESHGEGIGPEAGDKRVREFVGVPAEAGGQKFQHGHERLKRGG